MHKSVVALIHAGYWLLYCAVLVFIQLCLRLGTNLKLLPLFSDLRFEVFLAGFALIPAFLGFYSFYSFLFDNFLKKRQIALLFTTGIVVALFSGILGACVLTGLHQLNIGPSIFNDGWASATSIILFMALNALLNGGMGLLVKGFISWFSDIKVREALTRKHFETELALVKSQLNPHFLFNTINNIDVLISRDPARASNYLNQLSDIMRFALYETRADKIPLHRELAYLQQYIELQKIRTSIADYVIFEQQTDDEMVEIAPMLLIPFVENAFKHAEKVVKSSGGIRIHVKLTKGFLHFECLNHCLPETAPQSQHSGLGNELIERRIALLYPDRHRLSIEKNNGSYHVKLSIRLHENKMHRR